MIIYPFTPSNQGPFQFQPILDGTSYGAVITWGLFPQGWYITLTDGGGNRIFTQPVVGSPSGVSLQGLSYLYGTVTAQTEEPHGFDIGSTMDLTLSGCVPVGYNGLQRVYITGGSSFTFDLDADPGMISTLGSVQYNIDLAWGYFQTSTLVFREASNQFEVTP